MSTISRYMLASEKTSGKLIDTRTYLQKCVHYKTIKIVKFSCLFNSTVSA